jgi:pimeloyl-ACP methyl ester carboxylesterase
VYLRGVTVTPTFPGAVEPDRCGTIDSSGVLLHFIEWGDPAAPPVVLCHGMWDHARSFATLAPLLACRYRVVAVDARGHGESGWAHAYTWFTDVADIIAVMRSLGKRAHLVGHSKGGGQVTDAARAAPELVGKVVNIDGFGPPPFPPPTKPLPEMLAEYLDSRRRLLERNAWRPYPSYDDLIERRRAQNPRLSREWLRYFLFWAARRDDDGWRWKADPVMSQGFGPWRPEWIGPSYATLAVPMLAMIGSEQDTWGPLPEGLLSERLARVRRLERVTIRGAGHFVHMEKPAETAAAILDFLDS